MNCFDVNEFYKNPEPDLKQELAYIQNHLRIASMGGRAEKVLVKTCLDRVNNLIELVNENQLKLF